MRSRRNKRTNSTPEVPAHVSNLINNNLAKEQPKNKLPGTLEIIGDILVALMAIGCGITTGAAFLSLPFVTGGIGFHIAAFIISASGIGINWYIFQAPVRKVLIDILGKKEWLQGLFEVDGECELLEKDKPPTLETLFELGIQSNAAYVMVKKNNGNNPDYGVLYYVNKKKKEIKEIILGDNKLKNKLKSFHEGFSGKFVDRQKLNYSELQTITNITNHRQLPLYKKRLIGFGILVAASVGITFGALAYSQTLGLAAAATLSFSPAVSVMLPYIAGFLAVATVISMTALMLKDIAQMIKTENAMTELGKFISNLFDLGTRAELYNLTLKELPSNTDDLQSIVEADSAYIKINKRFYYYNKMDKNGLVELEIKDQSAESVINKLFSLKQDNKQDNAPFIINKRKLSFEELQEIEKATKNHKVKTRDRLIMERVITLILMGISVPLAILGIYMTMKACAPGIKQFLLKFIPRLSVAIVDRSVTVIAFGFAFLGQIPFAIQATVSTINSLFTKKSTEGKSAKSAPEPLLKQRTCTDEIFNQMKIFGLYFTAVVNAVGNGLISLMGAKTSGPFQFILSGVGGLWNSLAAGIASINNTLEDEKLQKEAAIEDKTQPRKSSSSQTLLSLDSSQNKTFIQGGGYGCSNDVSRNVVSQDSSQSQTQNQNNSDQNNSLVMPNNSNGVANTNQQNDRKQDDDYGNERSLLLHTA